MLRVAMVADHPEQDDKIDGGVQAVTSYLAGAMSKLPDVDLHVITYRYNIAEPRTIEANDYVRHDIPGRRFGTMTAYWRSQIQLNHLLRTLKPHIVHGQGVGHDGIVASRSPYPSVLTVHGILQEEASHFPTARRRARHRMQNWLSKHYCIRRARHTILISPYVADYWGGLLAGQRHLVPNPIAADFFEIRRDEEPGRIFFAGRIRSLKGVTDLVSAAGRLADRRHIRLILAGSTDDAPYVENVRELAGQAGLADQVEFTGILDSAALRAEFARAAVLVLPSYQETAPMVIQEAMAAGVPVIATRVGGIPYQIDDGESGYLFEPGDIDALAARLEQLLADQETREAFSARAKADAIERYRADNVARATVDVYRSIVDQAR